MRGSTLKDVLNINVGIGDGNRVILHSLDFLVISAGQVKRNVPPEDEGELGGRRVRAQWAEAIQRGVPKVR